jgi:hypothetical protein
MRKFLLLCLLPLIFASCYKTEYSEPMTESGSVLDLFMTPEQVTHTNYVDRDSRGRVSYEHYTNIVPAKYSVIFQCEHGTRFVISGSDVLHRELYQRMVKNSNVTISYREVYHVDNKTSTKALVDYDFLDAKVK